MTAACQTCRQSSDRQRDLIAQQEETIRQLQIALIGDHSFLSVGKFTESEKVLLGVLVKQELATKDQLYLALYAGRHGSDWPDSKIIDVMICRLRRKLKRKAVEIENLWGRGYRIPSPMKGRLRSSAA